jgi:hypothetical protein
VTVPRRRFDTAEERDREFDRWQLAEAEERYYRRPVPETLPDLAEWEPDPAANVDSTLEHRWKLTCEERP